MVTPKSGAALFFVRWTTVRGVTYAPLKTEVLQVVLVCFEGLQENNKNKQDNFFA